MSGFSNGDDADDWRLSTQRVRALLTSMRTAVKRAPARVRRAAAAVDRSFEQDTRPSPEDLTLLLLWFIERSSVRPKVQKPKPDAREGSGWSGKKKASQQARQPRATAPPPARDRPAGSEPVVETAFAQYVEEQGVGAIRRKLRVPRSRVGSDTRGRRTVLRGDEL